MASMCIGLPGYRKVSSEFFIPFAASVYRLAKAGHEVRKFLAVGGMMTDVARNNVVNLFWGTDAEWMVFIDDDNVEDSKTTFGAIDRLLSLGKTCATGVYTSREDEAKSLMYIKNGDGQYNPVARWAKGEILQLDGAGLGFCVIHRQVFQDIRDNYVYLRRANSGGNVLVHIDDIEGEVYDGPIGEKDGKVVDGILQERMRKVTDIAKPYPFFTLMDGMTEDVRFWQMAARVGHKLYADTSVEIGHIGEKVWQTKEFNHYYVEEEING